jgi:hypothetical protein
MLLNGTIVPPGIYKDAAVPNRVQTWWRLLDIFSNAFADSMGTLELVGVQGAIGFRGAGYLEACALLLGDYPLKNGFL